MVALDTIKATGKYFEHNNVIMWTFKDEKICHHKAYNIPII